MKYDELKEYFHRYRIGELSRAEIVFVITLYQKGVVSEYYKKR